MKHQFCTFRLGELFMGIEVEKVQEVLRFDRATGPLSAGRARVTWTP